jgi:hypothetical protein
MQASANYGVSEMQRKIAATIAAIAFFTGTTTVSFAGNENTGGTTGKDSAGQEIGTTSSTHNPNPPQSSTTGLNRKDGGTGTDTSTHNPPKELAPKER